MSDDQVQEVLCQAFAAVELGFFSEFIDAPLAKRTEMMSEIPEGRSPHETLKDFPELLNQYETLSRALASGTTAVVALIFQAKLYVANVGDSRALLCKTDEDGTLRVTQLTVDHDLSNQDEVKRLRDLSLDVTRLRCTPRPFGTAANTRCLGNFLIKSGFRESELLQAALAEPGLASPDVHKPISLDSAVQFLVLVVSPIYKALEESLGGDNENVNIQLAQLIVDEFRTPSSLTSVAQAVVDRVSRIHHDHFVATTAQSPTGSPRFTYKREDMTLIIRNFNYPHCPSTPSIERRCFSNPTGSITPTGLGYVVPNSTSGMSQNSPTISNSAPNFLTINSDDSDESDLVVQSDGRRDLPLDEEGRIAPDVDFTSYYDITSQIDGFNDNSIF